LLLQRLPMTLKLARLCGFIPLITNYRGNRLSPAMVLWCLTAKTWSSWTGRSARACRSILTPTHRPLPRAAVFLCPTPRSPRSKSPNRAPKLAAFGNIEDANLTAWPETLRFIKAVYKDAKIVVPGHGKGGDMSLPDHTLKLLAAKINAGGGAEKPKKTAEEVEDLK